MKGTNNRKIPSIQRLSYDRAESKNSNAELKRTYPHLKRTYPHLFANEVHRGLTFIPWTILPALVLPPILIVDEEFTKTADQAPVIADEDYEIVNRPTTPTFNR